MTWLQHKTSGNWILVLYSLIIFNSIRVTYNIVIIIKPLVWDQWNTYIAFELLKKGHSFYRWYIKNDTLKLGDQHIVWLTFLAMLHFSLSQVYDSFFLFFLQVFDTFVILTSFIVDMIFVKGFSMYTLSQFIYILAFMLPWRVIRVTNSKFLVVPKNTLDLR